MNRFYVMYSWKNSINAFCVGLLIVLSLSKTSPELNAAIVSTGNVSINLWDPNTTGYIGNTADGALSVDGGSQLWSRESYIAKSNGIKGLVTVIGTGSKWTNSSNLYVGYNGSGNITIEAGGQVSSGSCYMGYNPASLYTATVTGFGSKWTNSGPLYIGMKGSGTLTVTDNGEVTTGSLYASLDCLLGNGTITSTQGAVLDADLRFDATDNGMQKNMTFGTGGTLTVNFAGGILGSGYRETGSLIIADGIAVNSSYGYLGYRAHSAGIAKVTGVGSNWNISKELVVGQFGSGTLSIEAGGQVNCNGSNIGKSDSDYNDMSTVIVTGASSKFTNKGDLGIGMSGNGMLIIENGGEVSNGRGYMGYTSGSSGTVKVKGAGSKWTNRYFLDIGGDGIGSLSIESGGQVSSNYGAIEKNATSRVAGAGSMWTNAGALYVRGTLIIEEGGQVSDGYSFINASYGSAGTATINGPGSKWINDYELNIGDEYNSGILNIRDGGEVSARSAYVNNTSLLSIDAGYGSKLKYGDYWSSEPFINNGIVRIVAAARAATGSQSSPITMATFSGSGIYQAVGGTWNSTTHIFTVSTIQEGVAGSPVSIDVSQIQRVLIDDSASSWKVGLSFLAKTGTGNNIDLTASVPNSTSLNTLQQLLGDDHSVLGAWNFSAQGAGYSTSDPVYLSFTVDQQYSSSLLELWRFDGATWSRFSVSDLTCNDGYVSFTSTGLSTYAVAVPEPATLVLLALFSLPLMIMTKCRKRG